MGEREKGGGGWRRWRKMRLGDDVFPASVIGGRCADARMPAPGAVAQKKAGV